MARPKWVPKTDEQRDAIAAVVRAAQDVEDATAALRDRGDTLKGLIANADRLDVPRSHLADAAGTSRSTIYRHLPATPGDSE